MKSYLERTKEELAAERESLLAAFEEVKKEGLSLDMSRGKPEKKQLDLSDELLSVVTSASDLCDEDGVETRNYGGLTGLRRAKELLAEISGNRPEDVMALGNSSLNLMYDSVCRAYTHGVLKNKPFCRQEELKWLCPVPGYDRHFKITEHFGIEMIPIPMTPEGPDMDLVEEYVNKDPAVKGIWCVPKYSNPQGYTYSDETVERFAALSPAAPDFRIYWDNAYAVHHLYEEEEKRDHLADILALCRARGNEDIVYQFCSTSKVTFAGGGIAAIIASAANLADIQDQMQVQTIGPDKVNQLRHVRFLPSGSEVDALMRKHGAILRPKFEAVVNGLEESLGGLAIGSWTMPRGGYFISFDSLEGCAKAIIEKTKEAGVTMTGAGATYPYGVDPKDQNIRIAPSFPTPEELAKAVQVFTLAVRLVSVEKLLKETA